VEHLRENLILFEWEPDTNGERQWVLHDPLNNKFFYLDFSAYELLREVANLSSERLRSLVETPLSSQTLVDGGIHSFVSFLKLNGLIRSLEAKPEDFLTSQIKGRHKFFMRLIEAYISFNVPLISPDAFLEKALPYAKILMTIRFLFISGFLGLLGIILATRDQQLLMSEISATFSLGNLHLFATAIIFTKVIHEFSHAFTAKLQGSRVPMMGVKFIVLFPLPYTDTSDTWRIYSHKGRRNVAAAGVLAELALACWASFLWNFAPNDTIGKLLLIIAVSTWISSVAINLVPFMRFDGYFVLMDMLKMPNMHARAGAMGKWFLRRSLLGFDVPAPELGSGRKNIFLITFAFLTWIYRFSVFLAITAVVYHFFIKILGILMFVIECWFFILRPIIQEMQQWWKMRSFFKIKTTNSTIILLSALCLALLFYPFQKNLVVPGMLTQGIRVPVYSEMSGKINKLFVKNNESLDASASIFTLDSPEVINDYVQAKLRLQAAFITYGNSRFSHKGSYVSERPAALGDEQNVFEEARRRLDALTIQAPRSADRIEFSRDYAAGDLISRGELIAWIEYGSDWQVTFDLPFNAERNFELGKEINVFPLSDPTMRLPAQISDFNNVPTKIVSHWELSELLPGELNLQNRRRDAQYLTTHFPVKATVFSRDNLFEGPVTVLVSGERESFFFGVYRKFYNIIVREAEF
jgi:putative peptide zinc metalloprotease protein